MRSAGVGIMFLIERVNQRLMTHPTNKTPAMIRNVVGHQPEQAGAPVPARAYLACQTSWPSISALKGA